MPFVLALSLAASAAPAAALAAPAEADAAHPTFALVGTHTLGGEGGWDLLVCDPPRHRVFVSHGTHVVVVDADSGTVVGDIPNTNGVHGIALAPELGRGYITNGRDSSVTIFDLKTLAALPARPATGSNPDAIVYDPATKRVFAFNGRGASATVIDAAAGTVVGTLALGGRPEFAVVDGRGKGYVNLEDHDAIAEFDTQSLQVLRTIPLAPGTGPSGLAIDVAHGRLFAACEDTLMAVVNIATGKVVATPAIGRGVDGAEFDPGLGVAFAPSGGTGTLAVIHEDDPDRYTVVQTVTTQPRARTMALDPTTHRVYLVTADFGPAPAPTPDMPRPRPPMVPGSFRLLVVAPVVASK